MPPSANCSIKFAKKRGKQVAAKKIFRATAQSSNAENVADDETVGFFDTTFKNDESIPEKLLVKLGLKASQPDALPASAVPLKLMVTAKADGGSGLKWKRNGNKPNTIFIIEAQTGGSGNRMQIGATSETSFTHAGQPPGIEIPYRVEATRSKRESGWSKAAVACFKGWQARNGKREKRNGAFSLFPF